MIPDYEYVKEMIVDVEHELKKIRRMTDSLNGTGYDVTMIHGAQDKYYDEYKKKFDDKFTTRNNYRPYPEPMYDPYNRDRRRYMTDERRMGYERYEHDEDWDYGIDEDGNRKRRIGYR